MESFVELITHITLWLEAASSVDPVAVQCFSIRIVIYMVPLITV